MGPISTTPVGVRSDLGPGGFLIAAAIMALFFADAVSAAPLRLAVREAPSHEVTLTVEADTAPTFQVYRGTSTSEGQQWVVELPGAAITDGSLPIGTAMLLVDAMSEVPRRGPGRVVLTFADDVDFDATTKKGTLSVRFHHIGDKVTLKALHAARVARIEQARSEERRLKAIEAEQQATERERIAKEEAEQKAKIEAELRAAAAERERLVRIEADQKARREAEQRAENERLAKVEAERKAAENERLARVEAERKAKIEADQEARRAAERLARIDVEQKARREAEQKAENERLAKIEIEAERARAAKIEAGKAVALAQATSARAGEDDVGFGGKPGATPLRLARATPSREQGFGGGRTVELSPGVRYERVALPKDDDGYGFDDGNDDGDDDGAIDEAEGRSVLSQVTVQRTSGGARVGVRVDGGARYHVARRGRDQLVLTLLDTRARHLDVRRTLDARALGGPITRVSPSVDEDRRFRVELVVDTRGPAPTRIQPDGAMLWIEVGE